MTTTEVISFRPPFSSIQGVTYIDYLEKDETVTGHYYAELFGRFVHFHHDNARTHTSVVAKSKLASDWSDFFLFLDMQKLLDGQKFELNEKIIVAMEAYFVDFQKKINLNKCVYISKETNRMGEKTIKYVK